jgi:predicted Zn-dependent protease
MHTGMGRKSAIFWSIVLTAASTAASQYAGGAIAEALGPFNPAAGPMGNWVGNLAGMAASDLGQAMLSKIYQGYSEDQEFKSDELALSYASQAGYKPEALVTAFERLLKQAEAEIMGKSISRLHSSHERLSKRLLKVRAKVAKLDQR